MKRLAFALAALAALALGCGKSETPPPAAPAAVAPAPEAPAPKAPAPEAPAEAAAPLDSPEPVELLLWHAYRGAEREAMDALVARFNAAHQNLQVRALPVPFDALRDKLQVTIPRGQGPDVFIFAHNLIGDWLESEAEPLVESISAWAGPELLQRYQPEAVRPLVYKKALYGLPLAYKSAALFYNRALIAEPPLDTDAMVALARQHTSAEAQRYGLVYEAAGLYFHAPFIHGFGGQILDEANAPQLDSPAQVAAAQFVRELTLAHKAVPADMTAFMVASLFNDGKAAMAISGPWFRGDIKEGVDYGVALLPTVTSTQKPLAPLLGVEAVFLNARSEKKKWAFELMRFLASDEAALVRCVQGKQPVPNKAVLEREEVKADPFIPVFTAQAARAVPMNASRQMQVVWSTMDNALKRALFDAGTEPAAALKEAQEKVTQDIARQRQ